MPNTSIALPDEFIEDTILLIRGKRVILDHDLAKLMVSLPECLIRLPSEILTGFRKISCFS
jgi:hypothetical protein